MEGIIWLLHHLRSKMARRGQVRDGNVEADEGKIAMNPAVSTQIKGRFRTFETGGQQLLPGIPDPVTLDLISPKLPWEAFYILSRVSCGWNQVVRSRQVYDARVRFHSTETLVLINNFDSAIAHGAHAIGLYSMRHGSFHELPLIPHLELGMPFSSQCISLDGKIYVLGGLMGRSSGSLCNRVYVMDLAGQGEWKRCASMKYARRNFGCGILDGRIYVCGGMSHEKPALVPEVYDPKLDIWSSVKSMTSTRINPKVTALGNEQLLVLTEEHYLDGLNSYFIDIYNPTTIEWRSERRMLNRSGCYGKILFMADGKINMMDMHEINVCDIDKNSWTHRHSICVAETLNVHFEHDFEPLTTLVVENELVTIMARLAYPGRTGGQYLVRATGFGCREERITWQEPQRSSLMGYDPVMCTLQL